MHFKLIKKLDSGVRIGELSTPHGKIETPFFMPVGTVGSVKAVAPWELEDLGAQIILSNTYHLYLRPGEKVIKELGGLHKFMGWDRPILTDSGGYQVFSLAKGNNHNLNCHPELDSGSRALDSGSQAQSQGLPFGFRNDKQSLVEITEDGVEFRSHLDGSKHLFTPESVIQIQLDLGVDILMPLDVCPSGKASREKVEESVRLTTLWAKRAKKYFDEQMDKYHPYTPPILGGEERGITRPLLHGIVQGGLYEDLRRKSAEELIALDFDGYSVGGLAVDLETREMWNIVKLMGEILPEDKQRYLMGVGTPDDIIKATSFGMDMFDCVLPTRLARHGNVYVKSSKWKVESRKDVISSHSEPTVGWIDEDEKSQHFELINLLNARYRTDGGVIDPNCGCPACRTPIIDSFCEIPHGEAHRDSRGLSRAYISHLLRSNEILGLRLTTMHNLWQYLNLMQSFKPKNR